MKKDEMRLKTFMRGQQITKFPKIYTIRRIVSDMTIPDTSGTWSPANKDTAPEDLRTILDVLAWISLDTKGKKTTLTKAEVEWILRIAKAAPNAGSRVIWRVVQRYMLAEAKGESSEALDTYLAFKPWESENRFRNYNHLASYGWIKEAPGRHEMDGTYPARRPA
jgi:hypothetical protein